MEIAKPTPEQPKGEPEKGALDGRRVVRIGRFEVGVNLFVQMLVWVLLVGMVNYWSSRHFERFDWGRNTELQLTPLTKNLLENLPKPVQVIICFTGENPEAERMGSALVREYQIASNGKLSYEVVNPDVQRSRTSELVKLYKIQDQESVMIFVSEGHSKVVGSSELAEIEKETPQQQMQRAVKGGEEPPDRMVSFNGESKMTGAILEVVEPKKLKVYFLAGHGEADYAPQPNTAGRSVDLLKLTLQQFNFEHAVLNLAAVDKIPEDAAAVLAIGCNSDYSDRDLGLLTEYWNRKGRLLFCVGQTFVRKPKLYGWLAGRGVALHGDDVIRVNRANGQVERAGGLLGNSPIIRGMQNTIFQWEGAPVQSIEQMDVERGKAAQLRALYFMAAPDGFWGETTPFSATSPAPVFDPETDFAKPLLLGIQIEKGGSEDPKVKLAGARMVVIGINEIFMDAMADTSDKAMQLAMGTVNWLVSRETLTGIGPKARESVNYSVDAGRVELTGMWVTFYVPLAIAIFGLYHLRWRHGKSFFLLTAWLAGVFLALVGGYYLVLYSMNDEQVRTMPAGLVLALVGAALAGAGAVALHVVERKKRPLNRP